MNEHFIIFVIGAFLLLIGLASAFDVFIKNNGDWEGPFEYWGNDDDN